MQVWVVTWFKTHEITSHHINYSIACPKPQNKRVLLGYCCNFVSLKPSKNPCLCLFYDSINLLMLGDDRLNFTSQRSLRFLVR